MTAIANCPKCSFASNTSFSECPKCGIIVSKFLNQKREDQAFENKADGDKKSALQNLAAASALMVKQQKEWGEILTGFETKNKYEVADHWGNPMFQAEEEGGSFATIMTRFLLTALRPFTMHIFSTDGKGLLLLKRPFRFYFHELEVCKANGAPLGTVKRRFSILRRRYSVLDRHGNEIYQLFGPILHPWTFQIKKGNEELGKITKKWSGLLKESVTDADNFGINFPKGIELGKKAILLGAVFLIDFVHFENKGSRN
jgi:uncharacterized protein YxjI